jgi:hypothetical protein
MTAVLIAKGANQFETIALVFATMEDGEKHMDALWKNYEGQTVTRTRWIPDGENGATKRVPNIEVPVVEKEVNEDGSISYDFDDVMHDTDFGGNFMEKFFISYYEGNIWGFVLRVVEHGKPIVCCDLD